MQAHELGAHWQELLGPCAAAFTHPGPPAIRRVAHRAGPQRRATHHHPAENEHGVELELTRVVKGDVKPGTHRVNYKRQPPVRPGTTEFLVFLGMNRRWRFVAVPTSGGKRVADGVLQVESVDESSEVRPNQITRSQVERFVKDRTLVYTIQGPLYLPKRGPLVEWKRSPLQVQVRYNVVTGEADVQGLPGLEGLAATPEVEFLTRGAAEADIVYSGNGALKYLRIQGRVESLDPATGAMRAKFQSSSLIATHLIPRSPQVYYSLTLKLDCTPVGEPAPHRSLTLQLGEEPDRPGELRGWGEEPLPLESIGDDAKDAGRRMVRATAKLDSGEELVVRFDCGSITVGSEAADLAPKEKVLGCLLAGDLKGRVVLLGHKGERELMTFTASIAEFRRLLPKLPAWQQPAAREAGPEHTPHEEQGAVERWASWLDHGWDRVLILTAFGLVLLSLAAAGALAIRRRGRPTSAG